MSDSLDGELDFRAVGRALWRRKFWILVPAIVAAVLAFVVVSVMTPRYKSEARVLYEGRESVFLRPEAERADRDRSIDPETVTSQVQLVLSRELARQVVREQKLNERPEFDPVLRGVSAIRHALALTGLFKDPLRMSPEERIFEAYYDRIQAYQVDKSRVIAVEFQSADPTLAARVANAIADGYIQLQQKAKQEQTKAASEYLASEIESLRKRVAEAESKAEEFRTNSNLFVGTNNSMLSNQQLGELSSQLAGARTQQAEAEAKARIIRDMLRSGGPIEYSDVTNSELIRRLNEQRITLRAQLAEQSSTLLGNHPRIKELRAQISDLERQIRGEAERMVRAFENDAKLAGARVEQIASGLDQLKRQAASNNGNDVQMRALEREAKAQRDLLESYLAKYREATARENLGVGQGDARVISRAVVSNTPYFPKKLPIILIATFATLFISAGLIATGELLSGTATRTAHGSGMTITPPIYSETGHEPMRRLPPPTNYASLGLDFDSPVSAAIERLRATPDGRSRDIVLGITPDVLSAATSIVLGRALAPTARVVLIDLAFASPKLSAISSDPRSPGIAELVRGTASFGAVITRDRGSRALVVSAGHMREDPLVVCTSPRLKLALEAISHTNEHVIIDGGTLGDIPLEHLSGLAQRVILAVPPDARDAAKAAVARLSAVGFDVSTIMVAPGRRAGDNSDEAAPAAA